MSARGPRRTALECIALLVGTAGEAAFDRLQEQFTTQCDAVLLKP